MSATALEQARQAVIDLARRMDEDACEAENLHVAMRALLTELSELEAIEKERRVSLLSGLRLLPDDSVEDGLGDFPQAVCGFVIGRVKVHNSVQRLSSLQGRRLWSPIVVLELSGGVSLVFSSDAPPIDVREKLAPTFPHGVRWAVSR